MPELPEVEVVRSSLDSALTGLEIVHAQASEYPRYATAAQTQGATICAVRRRGKFLIIDLDTDNELIVHLGMTGQLLLGRGNEEYLRHDHVHMKLDVGSNQLILRDPRRFGRASLVAAGDYSSIPALNNLGFDLLSPPLDTNLAAARLAGRNTPIKALILDQHLIAGVGNYIADESLHAAHLHGMTRNLTMEQATSLVENIQKIVAASISVGGLSIRDYVHADGSQGQYAQHLRIYARAGQACFTCSHILQSTTIAGRTSTFCPACQPLPE